MIGSIDIDGKLILFVLFLLLIWTLAFQSLIGAFKRRLYSADAAPMKEGIWAVVWGLGYFAIFALFGSASYLVFADWGYDRFVIVGLFVSLLTIAVLLGLLYERYLRLRPPIYDPDQAVIVTYQALSPALQFLLTKDSIKLILDLEFEYQQKIGLVGNVGDEQNLNSFIASKAKEKGKNFTADQVTSVLTAEEVYLKQLGILSSKEGQTKKDQPPKILLGSGVWPSAITISILLTVIIFGRHYIMIRFNDAFFIKESILTEKYAFNTTLDLVEYFDQLQHDYPKYTKGNNLKGLMKIAFAQYFLDEEKFDKALEYIQKAIDKDDKYLPAYITYGDYLISYKDDYDNALRYYQLAELVDETDLMVNARLGDIYYNYLGEKEKGVDYYNKALKLNPKYGEVYGYFVGIYTEKGEYEKAIQSYHKALRYGADQAFVHYNAALTYKSLDKLDEAKIAINRSLDKNPRSVDSYILKAEIYEQKGDKEEAISLMEKVVADHPQSVDALNFLGNLYTSRGLYKEAIKTYQSAVNTEADQKSKAMVYENLGLVYHNNTKQFDLAEEVFKNALKYDPKQATIYINLGETYREKGMLKEAADHQIQALQLDPQNALAHNNLGYTLALQGKIKEATLEFEKALEIDPNLTIAKENLEQFKKK